MQAVFAISTNSVQFYSILERLTSEFIYICRHYSCCLSREVGKLFPML